MNNVIKMAYRQENARLAGTWELQLWASATILIMFPLLVLVA